MIIIWSAGSILVDSDAYVNHTTCSFPLPCVGRGGGKKDRGRGAGIIYINIDFLSSYRSVRETSFPLCIFTGYQFGASGRGRLDRLQRARIVRE